jgi:hypothetical protein
MLRTLFVLSSLLLATVGHADTQRVEDLEFQRILVHGSTTVEITQGEDELLQLRGSSKDLEKQPFFLDGDTLVLGQSKAHPGKSFSDVKFKLTVARLEHLQLTGSGEVYVKPLEARDLHVSVEGSGEMKLFGVNGQDVTLIVSGSGEIQVVELVAQQLQIVLSGSGEIQLGKLSAQEIEASVNGSGDIVVQDAGSADSVEINIVGSGDVDGRRRHGLAYSGLRRGEYRGVGRRQHWRSEGTGCKHHG